MSAPTMNSVANVARTQLTRRSLEQFAKGVVEFTCMWLNSQQEQNRHGREFSMDLASIPGATKLTDDDCVTIEKKVMRLLDERTPVVYRVRPSVVNLREFDGTSMELSILFS
jgi:hypothetical protein